MSVCFLVALTIVCAATLTPAQVPVDVHVQLNVSVFLSPRAHNNATQACCDCVSGDVGGLPLPVVAPVGWNLSTASIRAIGNFSAPRRLDDVSVALGATLLGPAGSLSVDASVHSVCLSVACFNVQRNVSAWLDASDAARLAFDYNGNNSIQVRNNGSACVSEVQFALQFVNLGPYVERLVPQIGPLHGGTDVLVLGVNLREDDMPACSFDSVLVDAHPVVNAEPGSALRCRAPPAPPNVSMTTQVEFRVVVGREHGRSDIFPYPPSPALTFLYYESPSLLDMAPQRGAPDASTPVTINGTNFFVGASQLSCRFGTVIVTAVRLSDDALQCTAPPLGEHTRVDVTVPIAVSLNGYDFVVAQHFNFTYDAAADELETLTSQLEAIVVVVVVVASATVICLAVALYRRRQASGARGLAAANAANSDESRPWFGDVLDNDSAAAAERRTDAIISSLEDRRFDANELQMVRRIGKGSFGEVWLASWRGTSVAVKKLPASFLNDPASVEEFKREGRLLRRLHHPNIVQLIGATAAQRDVLLIVEYMRRGSVHDLLQATISQEQPAAAAAAAAAVDQPAAHRLSINDNSDEVVVARAAAAQAGALTSSAAVMPLSPSSSSLAAKAELAPLPMRLRVSMLCDAARGMLYLHSCRPVVVHRDLKPRNLLVSGDWRVKLCDFGLSTVVSQSRNDGTMTACGTPAYTAPEILRNFKYCFAASDHQLLTNRGFLFLDEVLATIDYKSTTNGNEVHVHDWRGLAFASYDSHRGGALVYEQPDALIVNAPPADGSAPDLIHFTHRGAAKRWESDAYTVDIDDDREHDMSVVVTPEHNMLVRTDGRFVKRMAKDVLGDVSMQRISFLARVGDAMEVDDDDDAAAAAARSTMTSDAALELYGRWLVTAGNNVYSTNQTTMWLELDAFVSERLSALPSVEWRAVEPRGVCIGGREWCQFFAVGCGAMATWVWSASPRALRRIVAGACASVRSSTLAALTDSVAMRDDLSRLALHAGYSPSVRLVSRRVSTATTGDDLWRVTFDDDLALAEPTLERGRDHVERVRGTAAERYRGVPTWCVSLPSGFVVVRRAQRAVRTDHAKVDGGRAVVVKASRPTIQGNCHKADVFSMGVVLWEVYTRLIPYKQMPPFQIVFAVGTQNMRPPVPADMPPEWSALMQECWDEDDNARPSFAEILERLTSLKNSFPAELEQD